MSGEAHRATSIPISPPADYPRVVTHDWPICQTCHGAGEENEQWDPAGGALLDYRRIDGSITEIRAGAERQIIDPTAPPAYVGPCRTCYGVGRRPPPGWVDPVWDEQGRVLEPGSVPQLQRLVAARRRVQGGMIR